MCGLYGLITGIVSPGELNAFKELAIVSQLRGTDSTGVMFSFKDKGKLITQYHKDAVNASTLVKEQHGYFERPNTCMLAGHNRAATMGDINKELAHPFPVGHVCGMHNGTIGKFAPKAEDKETMSDSKLLFQKLSEKGLVDTLEEIGWGGAYALVWVNTSENTLNFVRNRERSLYYVYTEMFNTMIWASEKRFLYLAMSGLNYKWRDIIEFKPHHHYTIKIGQKPDMEVEELKIPFRSTPEPSQDWEQGYYYSGWRPGVQRGCAGLPQGNRQVRQEESEEEKAKRKGSTVTPIGRFLPENLVPETGDPILDLFGEVFDGTLAAPDIPDDEWMAEELMYNTVKAALDKGCQWCGTCPPIEDKKSITHTAWIEPSIFLCPECTGAGTTRTDLMSTGLNPDRIFIGNRLLRQKVLSYAN